MTSNNILQQKFEDLKAELEFIRKQLDLYKIFFHDSRDAIVIVSTEGFLDCNQAALDLFLFDSKEEFLKQSPGDLSTEFQPNGENSRVLSDQIIKKALKEEIPLFEWNHVKKDGKVFPSEVLLHTIPLNDKKAIYAIIRDISKRAETIKSLRESEKKLKNIVEHSTNTFYSHTTDHVLIYFSPQVEQLLGYTQEEVLIRWTNLASDNTINEKGYELTVKAIETGQMQEPYELELVHKSGKKVLVEVREAPVVENGKTVGIVGALVDITERKNAENALKESEEKFRILIERAYDPILIIDNYNFIDCNNAAVNILGLKSKNEIFNVHPSKLSPKYQPDGNLSFDKAQTMMDIAYKKGNNRFEWIHLDKSGKELYMDVALTKIPYSGKDVIFSVWRNIAKQKQYETEILEERKRLSILFEQSADGILVGINKGEIVEANESMCRLTGYSKQELIGKNINMLFTQEILENKPLRYDLVKKGDTIIKERDILRKDGSIIQIEMNTKVLDDGRIQSLFRNITKRKETEQALRESEEKYRLLIDGQTDLVVKIDREGKFLFVSPSYCEKFGKTEKELLGKKFMPLVHKEDREKTTKEMEKLCVPPHECYIEQRAMTKYGWRWLAWSDKAVLNKDNEIVEVVGVGRDITEKKEIELLIKESEQKYRMLFESANDAIFIMDKDIFIDCNDKTLDMFACKREQIIGEPPYKFSPKYQPDGEMSKKKAIENINLALKGGSNTFEWVHKKYNGEEFNAEVSLNAFDYSGKLCIQAIVRDITERKKNEKLIKDNEEKIRNIFNSSSDIILIVNEQKKVINVNQAVEKNLGYDIEEFIGKSPVEFIIETDASEVGMRISKMLKGERVPNKELIMISKIGEKIPFEVNSRLINYEGKKAVLSVIRNIKERKEWEQKIFDVMIETEENERQRLASDIHDEVGPLLSSLKMYIEMLDNTNSEEKKNFIQKKLKSLVLESIINVREVSNALSPNLLNQYGLVTAIKPFLDTQQELINIHFTTNIGEERFGIKLETVYYRILKELINNTLKHAKATKISINIEYSENKLILKYRDNGVGFSKEKLKYYKSKGQGLTNIETRVKTINGRYSITTKKDNGFNFELVTTLN